MPSLYAYILRKRLQYGDKFNQAGLAPQFKRYFESGERIEVAFKGQDGKVYTTKRGTVDVTTGWRPSFMLMLTRRSISSSWLLSENDEVLSIVPRR